MLFFPKWAHCEQAHCSHTLYLSHSTGDWQYWISQYIQAVVSWLSSASFCKTFEFLLLDDGLLAFSLLCFFLLFLLSKRTCFSRSNLSLPLSALVMLQASAEVNMKNFSSLLRLLLLRIWGSGNRRVSASLFCVFIVGPAEITQSMSSTGTCSVDWIIIHGSVMSISRFIHG